MKNLKIIVLFVIVILIGAGISAIFYGSLKVYSSKTYKLSVKTTQELDVGLNTDVFEDKIVFGTVPAGGSSTRTLNITNDLDRDLRAEFKLSGELAEWVQTPGTMNIPSNGIANFNITVFVPENVEPSDYYGKLKIRLLKT
ncbi:hypothetical protein KY328_04840 [Candidatus Woesearchaeota archaeon]|nr:hypothetical protein [Candidatus Woesearchaeota archaeon]MBW3022225.1 hypothetical protein [Candidatus Woesearchaeota archaeon]